MNRPNFFHRRGLVPLLILAGVAGLVIPASLAQERAPEGLKVGPWVLAPEFGSTYGLDSNVFFRDEVNAERDEVSKLIGALRARMPFRNSRLDLSYQATRESYADNEFPRDLSQIAGMELELRFRTGDKLTLRDEYRRDFARFDPEVDEQIFRGQPYNINRWEIDLERDEPDRQGYRIRIRRQDFIYDGDVDIGFFEYRGFDNLFEYRQPLPSERSWVVRYQTRRFNHYLPNAPDQIGIPFRKERTDNVQFGMRGFVGEGQPFRAYLGYGRFRYEGASASEFDGITGQLAWRLRLGGRTVLDLEALRRPLPSNFPTYYINNAFRSELERRWLRWESGTSVEYVRNDYADVLVGIDCAGKRQDTTYRADLFAGWRVHDRFRLNVSGFYAQRSSNCESTDYQATGIETGFTLGWF